MTSRCDGLPRRQRTVTRTVAHTAGAPPPQAGAGTGSGGGDVSNWAVAATWRPAAAPPRQGRRWPAAVSAEIAANKGRQPAPTVAVCSCGYPRAAAPTHNAAAAAACRMSPLSNGRVHLCPRPFRARGGGHVIRSRHRRRLNSALETRPSRGKTPAVIPTANVSPTKIVWEA